ncbi:MAG TPA: type II toxin-antitoxin system PemK/MazF family toxin [Verrucomicrobiae bacterium]
MTRSQRGEIWEVEFRPAVGAEIRKARPAVVINVPELGRLPLCIVVPITEWRPTFAEYAWFVHLPPTPQNGLAKESGADAFQVKSVSEDRLQRRLGRITDEQAELIAAAIALCVGY